MKGDVQCYACDRFRLKSAEKMAEHGFGNCQFRSAAEYVSAHHQRKCEKFHPAPEAITLERESYFNKRKEKRK